MRFAACVAARSFMLALEPADREPYYPQLLPHLCFNRYDVAEGVSAYSQATWRLVMGDEGRMWVARCLPQVTHPCCQLPFAPLAWQIHECGQTS